MFEVSDKLLSDYAVLQKIGVGGMGAVYLVRSLSSTKYYAVKINQFPDPEKRRRFLEELLIWIDLPNHPYITACHFFRTVGDRVAIFAELVEGGSLSDRIKDRDVQGLKQLLDIGIMTARGLQVIHTLNLIHQDVKPSNILVNLEEVAKITDFGLAKAITKAEINADCDRPPLFISVNGMTQAYRSPEQASGEPLTYKTDIWSWGVSMLEAFKGEVTWLDGQAAAEALEDFIQAEISALVKMPPGVREVLRRCFSREPSRRWDSMADVEDELKRIYRKTFGEDYPRESPLPTSGLDHYHTPTPEAQLSDPFGAKRALMIPQMWLRKALREGGHDPDEVMRLPAAPARSRRAASVAALAVYDEAQILFESLIDRGRQDLEEWLASLCVNRATVHVSLDDVPGAVSLCERAISLFKRLSDDVGERDQVAGWAAALSLRARLLSSSGDNKSALEVADQSIALFERLGLHGECADVLLEKVVYSFQLGDLSGAIKHCDRAITLLQRPGTKMTPYSLFKQASAYGAKASVLKAGSNLKKVISSCDRAIAIFERILKEDDGKTFPTELPLYLNSVIKEDERARLQTADHATILNGLATCLNDKALALAESGDPTAINYYRKAIAILLLLVNRDGRQEYARYLAAAYANTANVARGLGDWQGAIELFDEAISIYERLVFGESQEDSVEGLCVAYLDKAVVLSNVRRGYEATRLHETAISLLERSSVARVLRVRHTVCKAYVNQGAIVAGLNLVHQSINLFDKAIELYEQLIAEGHQDTVLADFAWARVNRASIIYQVGDKKTALTELRDVMPIIRKEAKRTGRADLRLLLDQVKATFKGAL